ncbi:MAG: hypothetical protein IBJ03_14210 [Gemmatimonadaceae bacterium]|nr:hypothetical protein [Gemmatimonadaceae bacterium]
MHDESNPPTEVTLEPWMLELARDAADELDASIEVPRDMMWARIARARNSSGASNVVGGPSSASVADATSHSQAIAQTEGAQIIALPVSRWSRWSRQAAGLAAVLVAGVAIGRLSLPSAPAGKPLGVDSSATVALADSLAQSRRDDPAHVAMQEHLARTVSLLTTVGDGGAPNAAANLTPLAKELLSTTRLLLDQPQLRDERTRRLLQDLELVLVQVIQARGSAPETQRAPQETLQETDLLTRVRAVVTASAGPADAIYGGD